MYKSRNVRHVIGKGIGTPLSHTTPTYAFIYAQQLLQPLWATFETQNVHHIIK